MSAAAAGAGAPVVPAAITVPPAFKKLVIIVAGMFYSGQCPPAWWVDAADPKKDAPDPEHAMFQQEKKAAQISREAKRKAQQDTTGLGVILLTSLTEEQWVEEDDMARKLNLPNKMVRKALRYLEQEQLLRREHRKETKTHRKQEREMQIKAGLRAAPGSSAAAAAAAGGDPAAAAAGGDEEDTVVAKGLIISYCALDYPRIVDSVRWRLATIRKNLQLELKSNNAIQKYKCPQAQCGKQYTSMDVWQMVPRDNGSGKKELCCAICGTEVVMVLDEGGKELGTMEDKKERKKKARHLLDTMDSALAPLQAQVDAVVNINAPDLLSYAGWMANQAALKQRMEAMERDKAQSSTAGSKRRAEVAYDLNTQVVVSFKDSAPGSSDPLAHGAHAVHGGAPAAAAGGGGQAAGAHGSMPAAQPASAASSWGSRSTPALGQQQKVTKELPPWLRSNLNAAQAAVGGMVSAEQQHQSGAGPGFGVKAEGVGLGLKADPGVKVEGIKADPGFKVDPELKQDPGFDDDGMDWQDVPGAGGASAGGAAAGSSQAGSLPAAADEDEGEEWEDV